MSDAAPLSPAYLMWGEDRPKIERAVLRLRRRVEGEGGMAPERFRADQTPAEEVVDACLTLSFGGRRLVIVEDAQRWKAADAAPLVDYLQAPNDLTTLALTAREGVAPKLMQAVDALPGSTVLQFGPPAKASRADRTRWLVEYLAKEVERVGGRIPAKVAREVVDRVVVDGADAKRESTAVFALSHEARKLVAYADGEQIDHEMVRLLVARHPEARVYELSDAIAGGRAPAAFGLLQDMSGGDAPVAPVVVMTQLSNHFRRVATVQALGPRPSADAVSRATGAKGFPVRKLIEHAGSLPPGSAQAMVPRLARLELDLRVSALAGLGIARGGGAREDGSRLVLELAVRDLLAIARGTFPTAGRTA